MAEPSLERVNQLITEDGFSQADATQYATDEINQTGAFTPATDNQSFDAGGNLITPELLQTPAQPSLVETKTAQVAQATQEKQAQLSPGDLLKADAARIRKETLADASRSPYDIVKDVGSSLAQTVINNTAGLVTGLGVSLTAPKEQYVADNGENPTVVAMINATKKPNPLSFMQDDAIEASQAVAGFSKELGESLDSDQRKEQRTRYEEAKKVYQNSPEYLAATPAEKVARDMAFTTKGLLANPLIAEDIGVQGFADLGVSLLVGKGASARAKASLKPNAKSPRVASKKATDKIATNAAGTAAATQGSLTEASSAANESIQRVMAMTHEELIDSPQYAQEYKNAIGSDAEKQETAKRNIASQVAQDAFVYTGLTSAAIGKISGASKATGELATGKLAGLAKRGKAVAKETVEEAAQSATSAVGTNVAMQTAKPDQSIIEGVGEQVVQGAVGGALASGGVQAPAIAALGAKETTKLTGKVAVGTLKAAAKGVVKLVGSKTKPATTPAATKPVETVTAPITEAVAPIVDIAEPSEQVASVQTKVSQVQDSVAGINAAVANIDADENQLSTLLQVAAQTQNYVSELSSEAQAAIDSGTATPEEVTQLTQLVESISDPKQDSILGALGQQLDNIPALKESVAAAFTAVTTGDTDGLAQALGNYDGAGITQVVSAELTDTLLKTALYSVDFLSDEGVTSELLTSAADKSTGAVKAQYEALAVIKDIDTVASDITDGSKEFTGVNTYLKNLKSQIATGTDTAATLGRLTNFAAQRTEKADALDVAIATATETGTYPVTANWGNDGKWQISSPTSLAKTVALAEQVRKEEAIVNNALIAANTLVNPEEAAEPAEQVVADDPRQTAIAEATKDIDNELGSLQEAKRLRESVVASQEAAVAANSTPVAEQQLSRDKESVAAIDSQIAQLENSRERAIASVDQADIKKSVDPTSSVAASKQSSNIVRDMLTGFTGKRVKKQLEGQYADYELNTSSAKSIRSFLSDKSASFVTDMVNFIGTLKLTKADQTVFDNIVGTAKAIEVAPVEMTSMLDSLNSDFGGTHDLGLDNTNRFKEGVTTFKNSNLWSDTDFLTKLSGLETIDAESITELGLDGVTTNKYDLDMLKALASKRAWFDTSMASLNTTLLKNLRDGKVNNYDQNKLRFLLQEDGTFPTKVKDAAFMAYVNSTQQVTESVYNDNESIRRLLGLSDTSMLADVAELDQLRIMGTGVSSNQLSREFKQALGLGFTADLPQSVTDSVFSSMGGMLFNLMKSDIDMLSNTVLVDNIGSVTGFTTNTTKSAERYNEVHNKKVKGLPSESNFTYNKNKGKGLLAQISAPVDNSPSNWVGQKPPRATASDTHIRSNDRLTDEQVEAENISRNVAHVVDPTVASFHEVLGLENYKKIKGYVEDTSLYNAEHKLSVDGKNQEIVDSYEKVDTLLEQLADSDDKNIYFEGAFSSVRRQQRKGSVNDQGDKYHRALIGLKNNATVRSLNLNNLKGLRTGSNGYNFVLALAQAYGFDVDKQATPISVQEMSVELNEVIQNQDSLENRIANNMAPDGQVEALTSDIVKDLTGKSDHAMQGILTVARLIAQSENGRVTNFSHFMKAEVDGLTNGPAHSTFMNGLAGLSSAEQIDTLARGGYLVGDGTNANTHKQIGEGLIVDSYKTVAAVANEELTEFIKGLTTGNTTIPQDKAASMLRSYAFLKGKKVAIDVETDEGQVETVKLTRNGTKNPVTVTVYGGGARGIHAKMASEVRDLFAEELTKLAKVPKYSRKELLAELNQWSEALTGKTDNLKVITDIKAAKTQGDVRKALLDFKFDADIRNEIVNQTALLYGSFATDAIDTVFKSNKRSATLMNAGMNYVTALANDTFEKTYVALHEKRVAEGAIRDYDTLPAKDVGLIQRKLTELFPYLRTAIKDDTNIAKDSQDRAANIGVKEVRYPTTNGKESHTDVDHSARAMGLPGVRAIPVLTISIDGAVQINNHLLQGKQGNFLNVLDAIDRIADSNLRASNELFNVAEYMGLMQADTLGSVEKAVASAIDAQSKSLEIEGIEITPTLAAVDINDGDARLELHQEQLRQSTRSITNPIANAIGLSPSEIGNTANFQQYLLKQLEVERVNNKIGRDNFVFGSGQVAINQMAGIDNGHANVVNGQVVLSEEAKKLMDADGTKLVENFNQRMAERNREYLAAVAEDNLTELANTRLEELRAQLEVEPEDGAARAEVNNILSPLTGLWQDLRGTFNLDTGSTTYKLKGTNLSKFKQSLSPDITIETLGNNNAAVQSAIPSVGSLINGLLKGKGKKKDYLDALLANVEVEVTTDLPTNVKGSYQAIKRGNKTVRVIKVREGLTTKEANIVLAHELIHAITQGGIAYGIANPTSREGLFVTDLKKQMARTIQVMEQQSTQPASLEGLKKFFNKAKQGNPADVELALNEFIAIVGSEVADYKPFLDGVVAKNKLSAALQKRIEGVWNTVRKFLSDTFGWNADVQSFLAKRNKLNAQGVQEQDVLASILSGLGQNELVSITDVQESVDFSSETLTEAQNVVKDIEGKSDDFIRKGFKLTAEAVLKGANAIVPNLDVNPELTYDDVAQGIQHAIDTSGEENAPLSGLVSTLAEFAPRTGHASVRIDTIADQSKHEADAGRETTKVVVKENIDNNLGILDEVDNEAVLNIAIRGDLMSYSSDANRLRTLLDNPNALRIATNEITQRIQALPNVSTSQKNVMLNEAASLGARGITGGAYRGLNLPNATAIVMMAGTGIEGVIDADNSIRDMVNQLATLTGLQYATDADKRNLSALLGRNPEGVQFAWDSNNAVVRRISEQYGEGKLVGLPKGYIPEQNNPNRAIKVVPWADRSKYSGYEFVREFTREAADSTNDKKMALLKSKEGGAIPYVQGAMSTVEAAIGGFTTAYGSATDKSLPAITSGAVVTVNNRKEKIAAQLAKGVRAPVKLREGMLPNVNSMGRVIGYRYAIDNAERQEHLEASNDVSETIAAYSARITEQQVASEFNTELVESLFSDYDSETNTDDFVKVSAGSDNPELAEIWKVIPQHTKQVIKNKFGGNFLHVRKRDLDNALGYREWSISNLWKGQAEEGSHKELFINAAEALLGNGAVNKLRFAERILQEGVVAAKDLIVVKSVVVPIANVFSNINHLLVRGVSAADIYKDTKIGVTALRQYKADFKELKLAENLREVTGIDNNDVINELRESLMNNPIAFMVDAGLLSTIVEDVTTTETRGTVKEALLDKLIPAPLKGVDNPLIDAGKFITLSQGSAPYKVLAEGLEAGDFVGKFILYNELVREGMDSALAINKVRSEFINYNTLSNKQLDYLNKTGGVFFFKYFSRIQAIIMNTIKENPTRAFTTWVGADTIGLPSIFEATILDKDITATSGAYDLLNMAGGAHPINSVL